MNKPREIALEHAGQARCTCGALLCRVVGPSQVEVKCRRCGQILSIRLKDQVAKR